MTQLFKDLLWVEVVIRFDVYEGDDSEKFQPTKLIFVGGLKIDEKFFERYPYGFQKALEFFQKQYS